MRDHLKPRLGFRLNVRALVTFMRRALRIGLFIGTLIGVSAFATLDGGQGEAFHPIDPARAG